MAQKTHPQHTLAKKHKGQTRCYQRSRAHNIHSGQLSHANALEALIHLPDYGNTSHDCVESQSPHKQKNTLAQSPRQLLLG
jgi:hypothetical protein